MLIAIEGIDGSGKGTQAGLLIEALNGCGLTTELFSFPRYNTTKGGEAVGEYLNGKFGNPVDEVDPKLAALLYALDRFESREDLLAQLAVKDVVVCDRYVPSNLAHQCAKLKAEDGEALCAWLNHLEYGIYSLPVPNLVIQLDLDIDLAKTLIAKKAARSYTTKAADGHEADLAYLNKVRWWYNNLHIKTLYEEWRRINVGDGIGGIKPVEKVTAEILFECRKLLPKLKG